MTSAVFFIGIKGVGMTALALCYQDLGWRVAGSDSSETFITDTTLQARGIPVQSLTDPLPTDYDLYVYSGAYPAPETSARVLSLAEALADFVSQRQVVAVAGVGGKTTTSAMLATMFRAAGRDVGYYIGTSDIVGLSGPGSAGTDPTFIVEADEYAISKTDHRPKFALIHPHVLITTNILHDHPDIYPQSEATLAVFSNLVRSLPATATWIASEDDPFTQQLLSDLHSPAIQAKVIRYSAQHPLFQELKLSVFGKHNQLDALAAVLAGMSLGLTQAEALAAITNYRGSKRRQEFYGEVADRLLYDDYGHHPHEVEATLNAFRAQFGSRRLVLVFESHTYSRTARLLPEFARTLALADHVFIMPIFASARERSESQILTSADLSAAVAQYNPHVQAVTWEQAPEAIAQFSRPGDIILTMGAGVVYKLHHALSALLHGGSQ